MPTATATATKPTAGTMAALKTYLGADSAAGEVTATEWNALTAHDKVQLVKGFQSGTLTY